MLAKRIIIIGTMAVAITIGGTIGSDRASASPASGQARQMTAAPADEFRNALGVTSDEEVYDALYEGRSLADLADANGKDPQRIIELQTAELTRQLDERLANGSLSPEVHQALMAEAADVIRNSAYGGLIPR